MASIIFPTLFCCILVTLNVAVVQSAKEGFVRLTNGGYAGSVEIYHDGEWGTVCDDYWDIADATVVCRSLGYERADKAPHEAYYSRGDSSQPIWLNRVNCTGAEEELSDCVSSDWGDNYCSHNEDAGASCSNTPVRDGTVRLMDAKDDDEGRVEIFHRNGSDGVWGSICNDSWGYDEASVVCNQLGFGYVSSPFKIPYYGPGHGPVHLSNVLCTGYEYSLIYCPYFQWDENNCSHTNIVGIQCTYNRHGWTTPMTIAPGHDSVSVMAWWLITIIVVSCLVVAGLIIIFVTLCCICNSKQRSVNVASTQGYPTAATVSTGAPQMDLPPSYSNAMAYDVHAEKAKVEQRYFAQP